MMPIESFLAKLHRLDVKLWEENGLLRFAAPKGAVNPSLRSALAARKSEILAFIKRHAPTNRSSEAAIPRGPAGQNPPLSLAQQRLWFLNELGLPAGAFNDVNAQGICGRLDPLLLEACLNETMRRHEVLRTGFTHVDGTPVTRVVQRVPARITVMDLRDLTTAERIVGRASDRAGKTSFSLDRPPLMRVFLFRLTSETWYLITVLHHLVTDAWSQGILMREWSVLYEAFARGNPSPLPELEIQYGDFARWQRQTITQTVVQNQRAYWEKKLRDAPPLMTFPTDRPRPPVHGFRGHLFIFQVPEHLAMAINALRSRTGGSMFMILLTVYGALLARYSGQEDLIVGAPVARRDRKELEPLIGFLIDHLVFRLKLEGNPSFLQFSARVQRTVLEAFRHRDIPFEQMVAALGPQRDLSHNPLFHVSFMVHNLASTAMTLPLASFTPGDLRETTANFDLRLVLTSVAGQLSGVLVYNPDLFDRTTVQRMARHYTALLAAVVAAPDRPLWELAFLPPAEKAMVLVQWNDSRRVWPFTNVVDLLAQQAAEQPDAVAVEADHTLSFGVFHEKVKQGAIMLRSCGAARDRPIGLMAEGTVETMVALWAILKAGAVFLPLDPTLPQPRLRAVLRQSGASLFPKTPGQVPVPSRAVTFPGIAAQQLAYLIFTSGSSGLPKGIAIPHEALNNLRQALKQAMGDCLGSAPVRVGLNGSLTFDTSVKQWLQLAEGHSLRLIPPEIRREPVVLAEELGRWRLDILDCTPSQLAVLMEMETFVTRPPRRLWVGGEAIDPKLWDRLAQLPGTRCYNLYGPTETTVDATWCPIRPGQPQLGRPLGRPLANIRGWVLDRALQPAPLGVTGEYGIGGMGLARGYHRRPDLTAATFLPDPFAGVTGALPGSRLYRSGDLVRLGHDGVRIFMGRADRQIKWRGFRIELEEIDAALRRCPGVGQAVTALRDFHGEPRLVAYWTVEGLNPPEPGAGAVPETKQIRRFLETRLPRYMLPREFMRLGTLPLNAHGKLDRNALPAPMAERATIAAARDEVEARLCRIWTEVLGQPEIGIHDNFFELGGDSILAMLIVSRAVQQGLPLTTEILYRRQSIAELREALPLAPEKQAPAESHPRQAPLTPMQARFFERYAGDPHHYNQSVFLGLRPGVDASSLEAAFHAVWARHDGLRAVFSREAGGWRQHLDATRPPPFRVVALEGGPLFRERARAAVAVRVQMGLNVAAGPLLGAVLFREGADPPRHDLLIVIHHLLVDGVSWRVLLADLAMAYGQCLRGSQPNLAPAASVLAWAQTMDETAASETSRERDYWLALAWHDIQPIPLDFPLDRDRNTHAHLAEIRLALTRKETQTLARLCAGSGNPESWPLTALLRAFTAWTGNHSLLVDVEHHGRVPFFSQMELSRAVGWFTALFPLILTRVPDSSATEDLQRVQKTLGQVPNQGAGYGLCRYLGPDRERFRKLPSAEVVFNDLGKADAVFSDTLFEPKGTALGPDRGPHLPRAHWLEINAITLRGRYRVHWLYNQRAHRRSTIEGLAQAFIAALRNLVETRAIIDRTKADQRPAHGDVFPLTPLQEGMLFHHLYEPGSGHYVNQWGCDWEGNLRAFRAAWNHVVRRHDMLRVSFQWEGLEHPRQRVHREVKPVWIYLDWMGLSSKEQEHCWQKLMVGEQRRGFSLTEPPLMRWFLIRLRSHRFRFLWSHHHLILDGWSLAVVLGEVLGAYRSLVAGSEPRDDKPPSFRAFLSWLASRDDTGDEAFWREELADFHAPTPLPASREMSGHWQPRVFRGPAEQRDEVRFRFKPRLPEAMARFQRRKRITLGTLAQAAWTLILARYAGVDDVVFGLTVSGRPPTLPRAADIVGPFINTLPVRVNVGGNDTLGWLRVLQQRQQRREPYQHGPLPQIQRWSGVPGGTPLFRTVLVVENYPVDAALLAVPKEVTIGRTFASQRANYPLMVILTPEPAGLTLTMSYQPKFFERIAVHRLARSFQAVLEAVVRHPSQPLARLSILDDGERHRLLISLNDTDAPFPREACIHDLMASAAKRAPDGVAVCFWDSGRSKLLSYECLHQSAAKQARDLRARGVGPESRVGIFMDRDPSMLLALLAILKAGGAYVYLDPSHPRHRLAHVVADTAMSVVLTHRGRQRPRLEGLDWVYVDQDFQTPKLGSDPPTLPEHPAYAIYTSGSSGPPKGVLVTHRGLCNLVHEQIPVLGLGPGERMYLFASLGFDLAAADVCNALGSAATLCLAPDEAQTPGITLARMLRRQAVTTIQLPLTVLAALPTVNLPALKTIVVGGEVCPPEVLAFWAVGRRFINAYGPTEATVTVSAFEVDQGRGQPPIGLPIANIGLFLNDRYGEPVPTGAGGELCIAGVGLARCYLGRPGLTAEMFKPHPWSSRPGERLYHSGDLARRLPGGPLEFMGRVDRQVKIRGHRIEPGEVEAVLARHPEVRETAVIARQIGSGELHLLAYVVTPSGKNEADLSHTWRAYLQEQLPPASIPSFFLVLPHLPLNENGKLDREALPLPEAVKTRVSHVPPRNWIEQELALIWARALGLAHISRFDNFFELGGHSLLATRVISRIRGVFGVDLPLRDLFETPVLAALAAAIQNRRNEVNQNPAMPAPVPAKTSDKAPLSLSQERLWFLEQLEKPGAAYQITTVLKLKGPLSVWALGRAVTHISVRHPVLTAVFGDRDGRPFQRFVRQGLLLLFVDLKSDKMPHKRARELIRRETRRTFSLALGPPGRLVIFRVDTLTHLLSLTLHHLVADGWSVGILVRELAQCYEGYLSGKAPILPRLRLNYVDYAIWQRRLLREGLLDSQRDYWRNQLAGAPERCELPTDRARAPVQGFRGRTLAFRVGGETTRCLEALGREHGATQFMCLHAPFALLLTHYSGQEDILVGTPVANRPHPQFEPLIGLFANTVVLRCRPKPRDTFVNLLRQTRQTALDAYTHQDLPFEQVVEALQPNRHLSHAPLFQTMFIFQNAPVASLSMPGLAWQPWPSESETAKFDLTLTMEPIEGEVRGALEYSTGLFLPTSAARMIAHFQNILDTVAKHPHRRLASLDFLGPVERAQQLYQWNDSQTKMVHPAYTPQWFEAQAARTPDAIAVQPATHGPSSRLQLETHVSYRALNEMAIKWTHGFQCKGARPGKLIALNLGRTPAMVAALLGVMKSGAAYLPLDPAMPAWRQSRILADARPDWVCTDAGEPVVRPAPGRNVYDSMTPACPAYLIYTSGSTGYPKGILVTHGSLTHFLAAMRIAPGLSKRDVLTAVTTISFDIAALEMWLPLISGARLILVSTGVVRDGHHLSELLVLVRPSVMQGTPAVWQLLLDAGWTGDARMNILCGGEALPATLATKLRQRGRSLWNLYGPTEATIWVSAHRTTPDDMDGVATSGTVRIGRAMANHRFYVLSRALAPIPLGARGELFIAGPGLALGYSNRPRETARCFVPNVFGGSNRRAGERLYGSGDAVRFLPDGAVQFLGRLDQQVKIRGYRVEPAEVAHVLSRFPGVARALVVQNHDPAGHNRLIAYFVPRAETRLDLNALRSFLGQWLPGYMIPAGFVSLASFPLLPSGKVDRGRLPAWQPSEKKSVIPRNNLERQLAAMWCASLQLEKIGIHDDFFAMGGHSLLAARVLARIRKSFAVDLSLRSLFEAPTIAQMAHEIALRQGRHLSPFPSLQPLGNQVSPLSFGQQGLWFLDRLGGPSSAYNMPLALDLDGGLALIAIETALDRIFRRHQILGCAFPERNGGPVQVRAPRLPARFSLIDLSGLPAVPRAAQRQCLINREAQTPFPLATGPLIRWSMLRRQSRRHTLLISMHHIVSDWQSLNLFMAELGAGYQAWLCRKQAKLPELAIQYGDFASWQRQGLRREALDRQRTYWRRRLAFAPDLIELPLDRPRPALLSQRGAMFPFSLTPETAGAVRDRSRQWGNTLFMTLHAAFVALLYRYSGQADILVGTPISIRNHPDLEPLIGFFVNTLVLRHQLASHGSFRELAAQTKDIALEAFSHGDLPFDQVVEAVQPSRDPGYSPIFQVMFVMDHVSAKPPALPGLMLRVPRSERVATIFDLTLTLRETGSRFQGLVEYNADLFHKTTIQRFTRHFQRLLQAAVLNPHLPLGTLTLESEAERRLQLFEWNDTSCPSGPLFLNAWRRLCARRPHAVALCHGTRQSMSYGALDGFADCLARRLQSLGAGPETPVAILAERGFETLVGWLGIWKAGAVYVPLDPATPRERLRVLLEETAAALLLTRETLPVSMGIPVVKLEFGDGQTPAPAVFHQVLPENTAYIICTSGSTGKPKGVPISHTGLANFWPVPHQVFRAEADSRVLQFSPFSFDMSILEMLIAFHAGGMLHLDRPERLMPGEDLAQLLWTHLLTHAVLTPSTLACLPFDAFPALRVLNVGGEACAPELAARFARNRLLINGYGPTEVTIGVSTCLYHSWAPRVTIGRPFANMRVHVLDEHLYPLPAAVPGEALIAGPGLSRGYWARPDLTAAVFLPLPSALRWQFTKLGERLYKTGDRVRRLANGELVFLGRLDHQIKLRGFRIELGEIEAALRKHPGVSDAAVKLLNEPPLGPRLVAYLVPREPHVHVQAWLAEIKNTLKGALPDYMLPAVMVSLERLPLTRHGKVDRDALPAPGRPSASADGPRNRLEAGLAQIWRDLLGVEPGIHDNFFELGGHSLLAARAIARIREHFQVNLPLRTLFTAPTLGELAAALAKTRAPVLPRRPSLQTYARESPIPLSFAQRRLWFLDRFGERNVYNIPMVLVIRGLLGVEALERSLGHVVHRQECLRTTFPSIADEPQQRIHNPGPVGLNMVDLTALAPTDRSDGESRLSRELARTNLPIDTRPPWRVVLIRTAPDRHVFGGALHHIIADGWSVGVLARELGAGYETFVTNRANPRLPPLTIQYADYACWQHAYLKGKVLQREQRYWQKRLAGAPALMALPLDRPRPPVQSFEGAVWSFTVPDRITKALDRLARQTGTTLFMVLQTAFAVLLSRLSGQSEVVLATPVASRDHPELEGLIGFFVNTLAIRYSLPRGTVFEDLLRGARRRVLQDFAHQDLPFEQVVEAVNPPRNLSHGPICQVMFSLLNAPLEPPRWPGLSLRMAETPHAWARYDLSLFVSETNGGLACGFEYAGALFHQTSIRRMAIYFRQVLQEMVRNPSQPFESALLLDEAGRHQVLSAWNDTARHRRLGCLHHAFEAWAVSASERIALISAGRFLSFAYLQERARDLAAVLRAQGLGPERLAAILLDRDPLAVIAILAVLEAGAAYLPLDTEYPAARLDWMIENSGAGLLLSQPSLAARLSLDARLPVVDVRCCEPVVCPPGARVLPQNPAYVIYTSGSSGQPKGVVIEHRQASALLAWARTLFPARDLRGVLAATSFCFDLSIFELFLPLTSGGTVVLVDRLGRGAWSETDSVTLVNTVPSVIDALMEDTRHWPAGAHTVNLAGEILTRALVDRLFERESIKKVFNLYGPTEATTYVTCALVSPTSPLEPTIGRPIHHTQTYIFDENLNPLPPEVVGRLHVSGANLARGYHRAPRATAAKFLPHPFPSLPGERLYDSGDLASFSAAGALRFHGRADRQIKVRGYRVEPGEIEAALRAIPGVREAAVVVRHQEGEARLAAFVAPCEHTHLAVSELRQGLVKRLPEFMIPTHLTVLQQLPRTPNGKLDLRALPHDLPASPNFEEPRSATEKWLAGVWRELLKKPRIGIHDHFFDMGGHSLLVIRLLTRVKATYQLDIPPRCLFEDPTLKSFAQQIDRMNTARKIKIAPQTPLPADQEEWVL